MQSRLHKAMSELEESRQSEVGDVDTVEFFLTRNKTLLIFQLSLVDPEKFFCLGIIDFLFRQYLSNSTERFFSCETQVACLGLGIPMRTHRVFLASANMTSAFTLLQALCSTLCQPFWQSSVNSDPAFGVHTQHLVAF